MKRNITVAAVAAAALIAGGGYTAFATGDDHGGDRRTPGPRASTEPRRTGTGADVTAVAASTAALKRHPGTVASVERADDGRWEVELLGKDGTWRELKVDADSGAVISEARHHRDDDRAALGQARVSAQQAAAAALASVPGVVTEIEIDRDDSHAAYWEVDITGKDGTRHELEVNGRTAVVTSDDHGEDRVGDDDGHGADDGSHHQGRGDDD